MSFRIPLEFSMNFLGSSDVATFPTLTLMLATIVVIFSTICWVCMTSNESKSHPKGGLSRLYSSLLKSDSDLSDNYDLQPLSELILMFRSIQMLEEDESTENADLSNRSTWSLLKIISKKIKKDPGIMEDAAKLNLHILTLKYIAKILPTADHYQITIALDVMNNLLQTQAASSSFISDEGSLNGFIDVLLSVMKMYLAIEEFDDDDENYESTKVDSSMSDYFAESGYKFILAIGLLVGETPRLKTVCAERGGVEVVLECLKQRKRSSSVGKWGLWALMNLCLEHPPNKSIFVHKSGLSIVITVLRHNSINNDVQRQGLSLLFYILSDDMQAKFHVKDARRTALALGAVTVIEAAQINFKNDRAVLDPCLHLMTFLANEVESG